MTITTASLVDTLLEDLRQSLEPKLSHMLTDYNLYKQTHDAVLQIPFVKALLEQQKTCKCHGATPVSTEEPIRLEIIDNNPAVAPNLASIAEYINATAAHEPEPSDDKYDVESYEINDVEEAEEDQEAEDQEAEDQEAEDQEAEDQEAEDQEAEDQEADDQEAEDQEADDQEAEDQETEAEDQEAGDQETEDQEAEDQEAEDQEAEDQETEDQEAEDQEAEDKEAEDQEAEDQEAEQEAEEAEAEDQETEDEELELFEVEIKGKTYVTNDETNGDIYEYENEEVGEIVGTFKNGVAKMMKKSKSKK